MTDNHSYVNSPVVSLVVRISRAGAAVVEHQFTGSYEELKDRTYALLDSDIRLLVDEHGAFLPGVRVEFLWPDCPDFNQSYDLENQNTMEAPFPPLPIDHPALGLACGVCDFPLIPGDVTVLIPRERPQPGQIIVEAVLCHFRCTQSLLPLRCEKCGCVLQGGATHHSPECPWTALIAMSNHLGSIQ